MSDVLATHLEVIATLRDTLARMPKNMPSQRPENLRSLREELDSIEAAYRPIYQAVRAYEAALAADVERLTTNVARQVARKHVAALPVEQR